MRMECAAQTLLALARLGWVMKRTLLVYGLFVFPAAAVADARLVNVRETVTVAPAPRLRPDRPPPPPGDTVVRICFTDDPMIAEACRALVRYQRMCGLKVIALENPTLDEVRTQLKGLPPNTNVSISSHGVVVRRDRSLLGRHHLLVRPGLEGTSSPPGVSARIPIVRFPELELARLGLPFTLAIPPIEGRMKLLPTKALLEAIDETLGRDGIYPGKHLAACHSGQACDDQARCTGASCRADEVSFGFEESIEDQERVLAYLACSPKAFQEADTDQSGALEANEIAAYFEARKLPRGSGGLTMKPQWSNFVLYATKPRAPRGFLAPVRHAGAVGALTPPRGP